MYQTLSCGRLLNRYEQSKDDGPSIEDHWFQKPRVPKNGQNWENRYFALRLTFPPLAYL